MKISKFELNQIYNVDCLEMMKQLPDNSVDLIVTDPPYGINIAKDGLIVGKQTKSCLAKRKDYGIQDWDKEIPQKDIFKEMFRISKNQIIFGGNYMTDFLKPSRCWVVWDKKNDESPFADCELAWTSFDSSVRIFRHRWNGMLQEHMNWKEKRYHPTQKPVKLGHWILDKFAKEGDIIFDPFSGSGSFLIACKNKGFDFIGCELDKGYCEIANKRLQQENLKSWFE